MDKQPIVENPENSCNSLRTFDLLFWHEVRIKAPPSVRQIAIPISATTQHDATTSVASIHYQGSVI
jgi:hypothetical protein